MNENQYIIDAFTKEGDNTNLEVDNLNVGCITSKNNNFELDSEGNLTVKSLTAGDVRLASQLVRDLMYPVGSIYLAVNSTNPTDFFGGEWEQIEDTFLLASGKKYINGATGGEETHKLNIEEMPSHNHAIRLSSGNTTLDVDYAYLMYDWGKTNTWGNAFSNHSGYVSTNTQVHINKNGGNKEHNNMPPYLAVCVWKRIK